MFRLLPFLLLLACSSTPPRHYAQGAPMRPPPPVFSPSQDAPHTTGQPGHLKPQPLPRSPHSRVLPPSKEPGLWSGDRPKAAQRLVQQFEVMDFNLPVPPDSGRAEEQRVGDCALTIFSGIAESGSSDALWKRLQKERACAISKLYVRCSIHGLRKAGDLARTNPAYSDHIKWWEAIKAAADKSVKDTCGDNWDDEINSLLERSFASWNRIYKSEVRP